MPRNQRQSRGWLKLQPGIHASIEELRLRLLTRPPVIVSLVPTSLTVALEINIPEQCRQHTCLLALVQLLLYYDHYPKHFRWSAATRSSGEGNSPYL
jgi:hypothetical protein